MDDWEERLEAAYDTCAVLASDDAYVYVCDMKRDLSKWSPRAVEYFGLPGSYMEHAGKIWLEYIHPDDREAYKNSIDGIFLRQEKEHLIQYRARNKNGDYIRVTCRGVVLYSKTGEPQYFCGNIINNDSRIRSDLVTSFKTLHGFLNDLNSPEKKGKPLQIMQVGINDFSRLNEIYGYSFGDKVLKELSDMLELESHKMGQWYRMDGTAFAIVCSGASPEKLKDLYNRIKYNTTHNFIVNGVRVVLSFFAGIVSTDSLEADAETMYSCLWYAYNESKNNDIGNVYVLTENVSEKKRFSLERINVIRNSIVDNCSGFFLCYQPIVDAITEKLVGAEALIRWKHKDYGTVPPLEFVDVLETDNLYPDLGIWILQQSIRNAKKILPFYPNFVINVNLSYTQIKRAEFVNEVEKILKEEHYPAKNLCLELTERCRLVDVDCLKQTFNRVREMGIKVALDDFGTGYSSIGILRELPVTTVKIDRSFVMNINDSAQDKNTVKFISDLANSFSASVCAEGIETPEMRKSLMEYKIKSFQGFYYSKPIPFEEFIKKYCYFE